MGLFICAIYVYIYMVWTSHGDEEENKSNACPQQI